MEEEIFRYLKPVNEQQNLPVRLSQIAIWIVQKAGFHFPSFLFPSSFYFFLFCENRYCPHTLLPPPPLSVFLFNLFWLTHYYGFSLQPNSYIIFLLALLFFFLLRFPFWKPSKIKMKVFSLYISLYTCVRGKKLKNNQPNTNHQW